MKKILFFVVLSFATISTLSAQQQKLSVKGYNYMVDEKSTDLESFRSLVKDNPDALEMFNTGRTMSITGMVIGSIGGFCVGADLGTRVGGGKGNVGLLIDGGVAIGLGAAVGLPGEAKMRKAVELYNDTKLAWDIKLKWNGILLSCNF